MTSISYPIRVPKQIMELAEIRVKEEHVDKTTAIKQLLYSGAEKYAMQLYKDGRISLSMAARLLDKSTHDVLLLAEKHWIKTGATIKQQEASEKTAKKL